MEDQNVKRRRERYQRQSSLLSKLTRQLSIHDNRAAAASSWSEGGATGKTFLICFTEQILFMSFCPLLQLGCRATIIIHSARKSSCSAYFLYFVCIESSPRTSGPSSGDDWRAAFNAAANGPIDSYRDSSKYGANGHSRRNSDPAQNGDLSSGSNNSRRTTPTRLPPAPPQSGSSSRY